MGQKHYIGSQLSKGWVGAIAPREHGKSQCVDKKGHWGLPHPRRGMGIAKGTGTEGFDCTRSSPERHAAACTRQHDILLRVSRFLLGIDGPPVRGSIATQSIPRDLDQFEQAVNQLVGAEASGLSQGWCSARLWVVLGSKDGRR